MQLHERIKALAALGNHFSTLKETELIELAEKAKAYNPWFTIDNVLHAFKGICKFLEEDKLLALANNYTIKDQEKTIGLVFAGNIPLVGIHDLLAVLLSGNKAMIKLSSKDEVLPTFFIEQLREVSPLIADRIKVVDKLKNFDAVIATGSNNTSRYFEYYFSQYPNIIRKNRTSVAILSGDESEEELKSLCQDLLLYFGLGCRNVSKLYVSNKYDFRPLFGVLEKHYSEIINHHKYSNNYDYYKSIYLVNREPFLDTGFLMFKEEKELVSPVGVVYYEYYEDIKQAEELVKMNDENIQCIVANERLKIKNSVAPGKAQLPEIDDFADRVDTLRFLTELV